MSSQKRREWDDAPSRERMTPRGDVRRSPSADQKKVRRQQRTASGGACSRCGGDGYVPFSLYDPDDPYSEPGEMAERDCPRCGGSGEEPDAADLAESRYLYGPDDYYGYHAAKETPVSANHREAALLAKMAKAPQAEQHKIAAQIQSLREQRHAAIEAEANIDWAATDAPTMHTDLAHSTDSDWMSATAAADTTEAHQHMVAAASKWYASTSPEVRGDSEEYEIQAEGMAQRLSFDWPGREAEAADAFVRHARFLNRGGAEALASLQPKGAVKARDLKPGDRIDVSVEIAGEANQIAEFEYAVVDSVNGGWADGVATGDEVVIYTDNFAAPFTVSGDHEFTTASLNKQGGHYETYELDGRGEATGVVHFYHAQCVPNASAATFTDEPVDGGLLCERCGLPLAKTASLKTATTVLDLADELGVSAVDIIVGIENAPDGDDFVTGETDGRMIEDAAKGTWGNSYLTREGEVLIRGFFGGYSASLKTARSLSEIAQEIEQDWGNVNFGAVPYLDAMRSLDSVQDNYYEDSGKSIVLYFLSNARSWRGETAKRIKAELRAMVKSAKTAVSAEVAANPDGYTHAFRTFLGLPPAMGEDFPECGAQITDAYDFAGDRPNCPDCEALMAKEGSAPSIQPAMPVRTAADGFLENEPPTDEYGDPIVTGEVRTLEDSGGRDMSLWPDVQGEGEAWGEAKTAAHATDIVAYTYRADNYTPEGLIEAMIADGSASPGARGMNVEDALDQIAEANGIDRYDEWSYDSDEFPKVIFRSSVLDDEEFVDAKGDYIVLGSKTAASVLWEGVACQDCTMWIANGEPPVDRTEAEVAEWRSEMERRTGGESLVLGDDHYEFSRSQCDVCGSMLGGYRHDVLSLTASKVAAASTQSVHGFKYVESMDLDHNEFLRHYTDALKSRGIQHDVASDALDASRDICLDEAAQAMGGGAGWAIKGDTLYVWSGRAESTAEKHFPLTRQPGGYLASKTSSERFLEFPAAQVGDKVKVKPGQPYLEVREIDAETGDLILYFGGEVIDRVRPHEVLDIIEDEWRGVTSRKTASGRITLYDIEIDDGPNLLCAGISAQGERVQFTVTRPLLNELWDLMVEQGLGVNLEIDETDIVSISAPTPANLRLRDERVQTSASRKAHSWGLSAQADLSGYWEAVDAQAQALRSAKTADEVVSICAKEPGVSAGDGWWGGDGDEFMAALFDAGWTLAWANASYHFAMNPPQGGPGITYTEGDIDRGIQRQARRKAGRRRRTAAHGDPYYNDDDIEMAHLNSGYYDDEPPCPACGAVDVFISASHDPEKQAKIDAGAALTDLPVTFCTNCEGVFENYGGMRQVATRKTAATFGDASDGYITLWEQETDGDQAGQWWWEVFTPGADINMDAAVAEGYASTEDEAEQAATDAASLHHATASTKQASLRECERCGEQFMYDPAVHRCPGEWEAIVGEAPAVVPDAWDEIAAGGVPSAQFGSRKQADADSRTKTQPVEGEVIYGEKTPGYAFEWLESTTGADAADVAGTPTPGRGVADYPQPKVSHRKQANFTPGTVVHWYGVDGEKIVGTVAYEPVSDGVRAGFIHGDPIMVNVHGHSGTLNVAVSAQDLILGAGHEANVHRTASSLSKLTVEYFGIYMTSPAETAESILRGLETLYRNDGGQDIDSRVWLDRGIMGDTYHVVGRTEWINDLAESMIELGAPKKYVKVRPYKEARRTAEIHAPYRDIERYASVSHRKQANVDWGAGIVGKQPLGHPGAVITAVEPTIGYLMNGPVSDPGYYDEAAGGMVTYDFDVHVTLADGREVVFPKKYDWLEKARTQEVPGR